MPARLLTIVALASSLVAAQAYVPGPVDDTPGAALVTMGAGVDGYTTYVIEGGALISLILLLYDSVSIVGGDETDCGMHTLTVTLQENSASALMTQYNTQGIPVVYNCALGADAQ